MSSVGTSALEGNFFATILVVASWYWSVDERVVNLAIFSRAESPWAEGRERYYEGHERENPKC